MKYRPLNTPKDVNHYIPRDFLRDRCGGYECIKFSRNPVYTANYQGCQFILYDTSNFGGAFSDWLLFCKETAKFRWIEIKAPSAFKKDDELREGELKPGEAWLQSTFAEFRIVSTDEQFEQVMEWMTCS